MSLTLTREASLETPVARLQASMEVALMGARKAHVLGPSRTIAWICDSYAIPINGICAIDVMARKRLVSVVGIPRRVWGSTPRMQRHHELAEACADEGLEVRFVPEAFLVGGIVHEDRSMPTGFMSIGGDSLRRIFVHLVENASSTLAQVARGARHPDPFHAVLHLVRIGLLESELSLPVNSQCPIFLPRCR